MRVYRTLVEKTVDGRYWYTLQTRKVYFLFRSRWVDVKPIWQPTYEDARDLITTFNP